MGEANVDFKQSTIGEILDSEREMVLKGPERYGHYCHNASNFNVMLQHFLKSIDPERFIFALFLSQIRKHHTLALFSALRLHRIQSMMNLRQVLEAGACAAYAIVHTDPGDFADTDGEGLLDASKELAKKRYKWLEKNFKSRSDAIKRMKLDINQSTAHSNIIYAYNNCEINYEQKKFEHFFFDVDDDFWAKTNLWQIANIAMGLMDLFYIVNKPLNVLKFSDDFLSRLQELVAENRRLKEEMMDTERYQQATERIAATKSQG